MKSSTEIREVVKKAFLKVHRGHSVDDIVLCPQLNAQFIGECHHSNTVFTEQQLNWSLFNLRKSASLGKVCSIRDRLRHGEYEHASQIAARILEDKNQLTIDRILCDPESRDEFDRIAQGIAGDVSLYRLRKAALALRKARRLRPELIKRIVEWDKVVHEFKAADLLSNIKQIPRKPGVYIFRDLTGYLYIGEAQDLHSRIRKHLDHSDRKSLAHYFWNEGFEELTIELHAFGENTGGKLRPNRAAYESELIATRCPRFNIRP